MNNVFRLVFVVLLSIVTLSASAQNKVSINLDNAIEIALNDNPTITVAELEIERQEYIRKESEGGLYPQLSVEGNYSYNIKKPVMYLPALPGIPVGDALEIGFNNSWNAAGTMALPLYMPTVYRAIKMNKQQMLIAVEQSRKTKIDLVNQVRKTYYAILLGENSRDVILENISLSEQVVETTQNSYDLGISSEYDLITAQVQLSNIKPSLIQTENSIVNTRLFMNMLLSLPLETELDLQENLEDFVISIESETVVSTDITQNTDLVSLDLQIGLMEHQLKIQKALRIPTVSAFLQYQVLTQDDNFDFGSYNWNGTSVAGITVSIPIFSGMSRTNKERQIKNTIKQTHVQRDYLEQNIDYQVKMSISNMLNSKYQMESNLIAKQLAKKGYTISKTRYDVGSGTIIELNSSQVSFITADLNYSQSIYDYMSALADYQKIIGQIN